ncbi:alpha/beta hydrolase [Variovorax ginsengisoli]|uniref:Acyl-CoA:diacylglycerol acyltransferase n=1 Tax=Variovorax ginsengisoli TaxID=363844 RepID=A0ABT9S277_9BURK|nr:alpha/beta hydrolase-fold protein [Variovorax ginsengisoli]MDP9898452.1 putative alpha/beta superfamily hydrolase [Variovorax ginsengisoli]
MTPHLDPFSGFSATRRSALMLAVAALSACGGGGSSSDSAPPSTALGQVSSFTLKSDANGYTYALQVFVPQSYATGSTTLPVIYVTEDDAPYGASGSGALRFDTFKQAMERRGTQAILVGISGTQRRATDFLLPGAESYLRFITKELIPAVERQYRADPRRRALSGLSHGGYFVIAALVLEGLAGGPLSFSYYLSTESSYGGHANPAEYRLYEKQIDGKSLSATVFLAGASRGNGPVIVNDLYTQMAAQKNPGLTVIKADFETGHVEADVPAFEAALTRFFA